MSTPQKVGTLYTFAAGEYTHPEFFTSPVLALDAAARLCYRNPVYALPAAWQDELMALWTRQGVDAAIYGTQATLWNAFQRRAAAEHQIEAESVLQEADALLSAGVGYDWAAMELRTGSRQVSEAVAEAVSEGLVR